MNLENKLNAKAIVYYGSDSATIGKLSQLFGEENVHPYQEMKKAFEFIKTHPVKSFIFETYQENPFQGVNEKDLDILLYYGSSDESLNKHMSFLPLDPSSNETRSEESTANAAVHFYEDLYERYLYLLPGITREELNESSIDLPEGLDFLSSLVTVLDDATEEMDKKLNKVNFTSDKKTVDGEDHLADLSEEVHKVKGGEVELLHKFSAVVESDGPQQDEEANRVSGKINEDHSAQRVQGSPQEEDDHKEVIAGDGPATEDAQRVKGAPEEQDLHKEVIAGVGPDSAEDSQRVEGKPEEQDLHKEVISGDMPEDGQEAHLIKGSPKDPKKENYKEVIAGESSLEKDKAQHIAGEPQDKDSFKKIIPGESSSQEGVSGDHHSEIYSSEENSHDEVQVFSQEEDGTEAEKKTFSGATEHHNDLDHKTIIKSDSSEESSSESLSAKKESPFAHLNSENEETQEQQSADEVDDTPIPADINQRNDKGQTPLMLHAQRGNLESVRSLIENGADIHLLCRQGKNLLHYAVEGIDDQAFIEGLVEEHGMKVTKRDGEGRDPFFYAVAKDKEGLIPFFLDRGARISTRYKGDPILHVAARAKALKSFKALLMAGADRRVINTKGEDIAQFCKKKKLVPFLKIMAAVERLKELKAS